MSIQALWGTKEHISYSYTVFGKGQVKAFSYFYYQRLVWYDVCLG